MATGRCRLASAPVPAAAPAPAGREKVRAAPGGVLVLGGHRRRWPLLQEGEGGRRCCHGNAAGRTGGAGWAGPGLGGRRRHLVPRTGEGEGGGDSGGTRRGRGERAGRRGVSEAERGRLPPAAGSAAEANGEGTGRGGPVVGSRRSADGRPSCVTAR